MAWRGILAVKQAEKPTTSLKLLYMFRYFCLLYGKNTSPSHVRLLVPLTQQKIADHIGLTRETTNIELGKLKAKKIVSCKRGIYTVDTAKLNEQIEDEYNPGIAVNMLPVSTN